MKRLDNLVTEPCTSVIIELIGPDSASPFLPSATWGQIVMGAVWSGEALKLC